MTAFRRFSTASRFALAVGAVLSAVAQNARAQADEVPPLPNVLLLVDTSGSMEFQADGSAVTCNPATPASTNHKSRWVDLVEVLTGTIENYSCEGLDRGSMAFINEYALASGQPPYDSRYIIPYHRPLSAGCAAGPGAPLSGNPFIYPAAGAIGYHFYSNNTPCTFQQRENDGILDAFSNHVRFGLMTFDTATDAGTGFGGPMASAVANTVSGRDGLWSYYLPPTEPGLGRATGWPSGCTVVPGAEPSQELGSRNGAAPPWEGRMVNFGNPNDGVGAYSTKNTQIQEILLATRPYGATPIAGMLKDARDFLVKDTSKDPNRIPASLSDADLASDYGPYRDEFIECGRTQSIILLTDGQPNMDLRPYCNSTTETPAGKCPYDLPTVTAAELYQTYEIKTHVIGFALDEVDHDNNAATALKDCSALVVGDCTATATANNAPLKACCTLNEIAVAGGGNAFFAANKSQLQSMISQALSVTLPATSRTRPVVAGGAQGSFRFFTGTTPSSIGLWKGKLERQRFVCDDPINPGVPTPQPPTQSLGDDFVFNVNNAGPNDRIIFTTIGDAAAGDPINSAGSIRPFVASSVTDGVGAYSGDVQANTSAAFVAATPPEALGLSSCLDLANATLTASACRDMYLGWILGTTGPSGYHRCPNTANCNLIGDIYHSTPQVLGRPVAALRDESYARYALLRATRPTVLYTLTNDGFLHAFRVTSNDPDEFDEDQMMVRKDDWSNELWALIPPAVLPNLPNQFPNTHQRLLDGAATISEVVAVEPTLATDLPTVFERSPTDAQSGAGTWRAVLVQGFGSEHSGYFALDVTNPVPDPSDADNPLKGGPRLLWQLTRDNVGRNLFGRGGSTPAIATLFFDPAGGTSPREIPVAVLPGGPGGRQVPSGTGCPPTPRDFTSSNIPSAFAPRTRVHCYDYNGNSELGARSLTIVRLDTGEIIRTFRQAASEVANSELELRVTEADIDSPITGQPMPFPPQVGTVANRIFVGDADGRLWKVDVSAADPAEWTMKLFFDLYPASLSFTFDDGQPVELPPALSVDEIGNLTLNVASGSQERLGVALTKHHVFALSDRPAGPAVGWYQPLENGERVLGPLIVFNSAVYFATYAPPVVASACAQGTSKVWGMHFVEPEDGNDLALGGAVVPGAVSPEPFADPSAPYLTMQDILGTSETEGVVAGVSIAQQPSCFTETNDSLGDDLLGFRGQHTISQIQTGKFQLLVHTGTKSGATTSGGAINTAAIDLPQPPALSFSSAWATIDE